MCWLFEQYMCGFIIGFGVGFIILKKEIDRLKYENDRLENEKNRLENSIINNRILTLPPYTTSEIYKNMAKLNY